jgi:carbonic anhydrase
VLPVAEPGPEVLRRTEQRAVVLQLERLMDYPMVRERVEAAHPGACTAGTTSSRTARCTCSTCSAGLRAGVTSEHAGTGPYAMGDAGTGLDPSGVPAW